MKTDREWLQDTMADAVADMFWERMNRHPAVPDSGKNSPLLPEPGRELRDH